jgi:two-component system chemotaxis response regulator CheY
VSGTSRAVLIVDDDADVCEGMASLLAEEGYEALTALDGEQGLRLLRARPGVALVLLDLTMPRLNAADFRAAQHGDPRIAAVPVVLMSAGLDGRKHAQRLGAAGYLAKPFKPQALLEVIERILRAPRPPRAHAD